MKGTFGDTDLTKLLSDSGLINYFETFRKDNSKENFKLLKEKFIKFVKGNTNINGDVEIRRIFPKILNIYAVCHDIRGTEKGRLTEHNFNFSDLMYNRINFRDVGKAKSVSRTEAKARKNIKLQKVKYLNYLVQKAINTIDRKYSQSEVSDGDSNDDGFHIHHIFSKSEFPQFAFILENLIKLTIKQHLSKAHPKGDTHNIDKDYQCICLLAKSRSIENSIAEGEFIYSKETFINLINVGLSASLVMSLGFNEIRHEINKIYNGF